MMFAPNRYANRPDGSGTVCTGRLGTTPDPSNVIAADEAFTANVAVLLSATPDTYAFRATAA
jgi:hypothetical protein